MPESARNPGPPWPATAALNCRLPPPRQHSVSTETARRGRRAVSTTSKTTRGPRPLRRKILQPPPVEKRNNAQAPSSSTSIRAMASTRRVPPSLRSKNRTLTCLRAPSNSEHLHPPDPENRPLPLAGSSPAKKSPGLAPEPISRGEPFAFLSAGQSARSRADHSFFAPRIGFDEELSD